MLRRMVIILQPSEGQMFKKEKLKKNHLPKLSYENVLLQYEDKV